MSKQPYSAHEFWAKTKTDLVIPTQRDPRQCWLLVRQEPADNRQGCFFITHAKNFAKFDRRPGFEIIGHSFDRTALRLAQRQATLSAGPAYQPPGSAHNQPLILKEPNNDLTEPEQETEPLPTFGEFAPPTKEN